MQFRRLFIYCAAASPANETRGLTFVSHFNFPQGGESRSRALAREAVAALCAWRANPTLRLQLKLKRATHLAYTRQSPATCTCRGECLTIRLLRRRICNAQSQLNSILTATWRLERKHETIWKQGGAAFEPLLQFLRQGCHVEPDRHKDCRGNARTKFRNAARQSPCAAPSASNTALVANGRYMMRPLGGTICNARS